MCLTFHIPHRLDIKLADIDFSSADDDAPAKVLKQW